MAKIKKVTVNYPDDPQMMEELQDRAMCILAKSIVKKLPQNAVQKLIKRLQNS